MRKVAVNAFILAFAASLHTPAYAGDFAGSCVAGSPDDVTEEQAMAFCSCVTDATEGNDDLRAEFEAAFSAGSREAFAESLSSAGQDVLSSCAAD